MITFLVGVVIGGLIVAVVEYFRGPEINKEAGYILHKGILYFKRDSKINPPNPAA